MKRWICLLFVLTLMLTLCGRINTRAFADVTASTDSVEEEAAQSTAEEKSPTDSEADPESETELVAAEEMAVSEESFEADVSAGDSDSPVSEEERIPNSETGEEVGEETVEDGSGDRSDSATWTVSVAEVSGSITCGDRYPADLPIPAGAVTVQLFEQGAETAAYTAMVTDKTYTISGVTPGTYELRVFRTAYATRTYTVAVEAENVVQDVEIHMIGDVNGDGKISTRDCALAIAFMNGKLELEAYAFACADVDGSGTVNYIDLTKINEQVHRALSIGAAELQP